MSFFPEIIKPTTTYAYGSLEAAVYNLKPETRKAIYAVSQTTLFKQGTWDGCVFNKLTGETGTLAVATMLGESEMAISAFIGKWDSLCDSSPIYGEQKLKHANKILKEVLEKVGLSVPTDTPKSKRVVRYYAYKSADTKFQEQLAAMTDLGDTELSSEALSEIGLSELSIRAAKELCNA